MGARDVDEEMGRCSAWEMGNNEKEKRVRWELFGRGWNRRRRRVEALVATGQGTRRVKKTKTLRTGIVVDPALGDAEAV